MRKNAERLCFQAVGESLGGESVKRGGRFGLISETARIFLILGYSRFFGFIMQSCIIGAFGAVFVNFDLLDDGG